MSQSYQAQKVYSSDREKEVLVHSLRCRYDIWLSDDEISLRGPGVLESISSESLPEFESFEDLAIYLVLLFENGLFPEEE